MKLNVLSLFLLAATLFSCQTKNDRIINLKGTWQFQADPEDAGISEKWFEKDLSETIKLPGSMDENGKGLDVTLDTKWTGGIRNPEWFNDPNYAPYHDSTNIRFPYWLQPVKKYTGAAWYQKTVTLSKNWNQKQVWLKLERPHWETRVWVNGKSAGMQNSLGAPHAYDITLWLKEGENRITVCVDNRTKLVDVGHDSHSISDHTQSNWNGMVGDLLLEAKDAVYFKNVRVFPDVQNKLIEIEAEIINMSGAFTLVKIPVYAMLKNTGDKTEVKTFEFDLSQGENLLKMTYPLGENAMLWDEFNPNVYELSLELETKNFTDSKQVDFGLREFNADGSRFAINGRPLFLRGTLECAIFPLTGYPPTDTVYWNKIYKAVKAHGLNHVRFHSWCPPKAAFTAADALGIYLQVECSSWANSTTRLGSGEPIDKYIWEESKRIVAAYGNHPSFVMMAYGNEPGGPKHRVFLTEFVSTWKNADKRRVYTGGAGWPVLEANQYHNIPQPRIQGWGEELRSIINSEPPKTDFDWKNKVPGDGIPVVSHEIGQWCVYPNFREMKKYTGVLKPKNFEIFQESLNAHNIGHLADSFLLASGKLQALCYKADIEAALRTPGFAGFQLLDLHDFPGQGTALVGVLDPFWEEKGYITPQEYSRFCNATVPLARLKKRIFTEGETLLAAIEIAHFGEFSLNENPSWKIIENRKTIAEGNFGQKEIPIGNCIGLGTINYTFPTENRPRKLTIEVSVGLFSNSWDIWVYPYSIPAKPANIKVVEKITPDEIKHLENGGKVLLSLGRGKVSQEMGGKVGVGFSSIFWNTAWTGGQKPHTLGILCNPAHPALAEFPTEYHSNWQWWDAMSHADAIDLTAFPKEIKPIVRIIDDWVSNRPLALIFEAKVGEGKLIVCGADLIKNIEQRPEARQLRNSLLNYIKSADFNPTERLTLQDVQKIVN